jgi:arylsulfatase A-like enzyme
VQLNVMEVHEHLAFEKRGPARYQELFAGREAAAYLRAVRQASDELADFVRAVSELPGGRDTLFVLTSDHGEGLGDHPSVANSSRHGFLLYASHLRVPLVFFHPGGRLPEGRALDEPVTLLDVMPTILDFAGLRGPAEMEGRSLLPLARGEVAAAPAQPRFAETRFQGRDKLAVYTSEWKYVENREAKPALPPRELHAAGVVEDGARTDQSAAHPQVVEALAARLREWERAHPPAAPAPRAAAPTPEEERQLRALGYLR